MNLHQVEKAQMVLMMLVLELVALMKGFMHTLIICYRYRLLQLPESQSQMKFFSARLPEWPIAAVEWKFLLRFGHSRSNPHASTYQILVEGKFC